jgi:hypothetical protein
MLSCRLKAPAQMVRLKAAAHLDELLTRSNGGACKSTMLQAQLAKAVVRLLEEPSMETRTHAKRIVWAMANLIPKSKFASLRAQHMQGNCDRRIRETLESPLGPPAAPLRLTQSYAAVVGNTKAAIYCRTLGIDLTTLNQHDMGISDSPNSGACDVLRDTGGERKKFLAAGQLPTRSTSLVGPLDNAKRPLGNTMGVQTIMLEKGRNRLARASDG